LKNQKSKGKRQKSKGEGTGALPSPFAFCLLIFDFCLFPGVLPARGDLHRDAPAYARVFDSVSLPHDAALVAPAAAAKGLAAETVLRTVQNVREGALLITEEDSPLSRALGVTFGEPVEITQVVDVLYPRVPIFWEKPARVAPPSVPAGGKVLVHDKWSPAPLMITFPYGQGRVLFLAASLDAGDGAGYARFPYLIQALLKECGVRLPFRSPRLHAFFDYGYRVAVDLDYFARRWRGYGIAALHVSAWHFWDRERDQYLRDLIAACHRQGIQVYAWFELPHVSDRFWQEHPRWREKTATLQDAHLDWRALMNLLDPAAFAAVAEGMASLLSAFDWDGVNLAELYFESPLGPEHQQRLTPMNDVVRAEFTRLSGWDPLELFRQDSARHWKKNPNGWRRFADYRASLIAHLHERLLEVIAAAKKSKPYLHTIVTSVDSLYDSRVTQATASDTERLLALRERFPFRLVVEDPAGLWAAGPARYRVLGERYADRGPTGVDINIVERYQETFPTKKQTGSEFLQLLHHAAEFFDPVLVYFEQSVAPQDLEIAAHALAVGASVRAGVIETRRPVGYRAPGPVQVNGQAWPVRSAGEIHLPPGRFRIEPLKEAPALPALVDLNAELLEAQYLNQRTIHFRYRSEARGLATFDRRPQEILINGIASTLGVGPYFALPPGEHGVAVRFP
jgi:hypothetical protein